MELTHYCIIRADLPLGVACAQLVHAAGESSHGNLPASTFAVVLHAASEEQLLTIYQKLTEADIPSVLVREPDAPWCGQAMSIGVSPGPRERVRRILRDLPLAFKEQR